MSMKSLAILVFSFALALTASAQPRTFAAAALILDDGAGHTVTLTVPAGLTGNFSWPIPLSTTGVGSAFVDPGTLSGQILTWDALNLKWSPTTGGFVALSPIAQQTGYINVSGSITGGSLDASSGGITNAGAISGATTIVASTSVSTPAIIGAAAAHSGGGAVSNKMAELYTVVAGQEGQGTKYLAIPNARAIMGSVVVAISAKDGNQHVDHAYITSAGIVTVVGSGNWSAGDIINYIIINP